VHRRITHRQRAAWAPASRRRRAGRFHDLPSCHRDHRDRFALSSCFLASQRYKRDRHRHCRRPVSSSPPPPSSLLRPNSPSLLHRIHLHLANRSAITLRTCCASWCRCYRSGSPGNHRLPPRVAAVPVEPRHRDQPPPVPLHFNRSRLCDRGTPLMLPG
jgi:hypothetical protein